MAVVGIMLGRSSAAEAVIAGVDHFDISNAVWYRNGMFNHMVMLASLSNWARFGTRDISIIAAWVARRDLIRRVERDVAPRYRVAWHGAGALRSRKK